MLKIAMAVLLGTVPASAAEVTVECQITNQFGYASYSDGDIGSEPITNPGTTTTYTLSKQGLRGFSNVQITPDSVSFDMTYPGAKNHFSIDRHTGGYSEVEELGLGTDETTHFIRSGTCHKTEGF